MAHQRKHTRRIRKTGTVFVAGRRSDNEILNELRSIARQMWGPIIDQVVFKIEPEESGVLAYLKSLEGVKRGMVGDTLYRAKKDYTLGVSSGFLKLSNEDQRKVLIHEAAHIGCANHDRLFRKKVLEAGGVLCSAGLEHNKIFIKAKLKTLPRSAGYATVEEFTTDEWEKARRFGKEYAKANPGYFVKLTTRP